MNTAAGLQIWHVTAESLDEMVASRHLDFTEGMVSEFRPLVSSRVVGLYVAHLPEGEGPFGQVAIRWDTPTMDLARDALGRYFGIKPEEVKMPNIAYLYVGDRYRRMGIGDTLMDRMHEEARTRHFGHTILNVAIGNIPARTMYVKQGYISTGLIRPVQVSEHKHDGEYLPPKVVEEELMVRQIPSPTTNSGPLT